MAKRVEIRKHGEPAVIEIIDGRDQKPGEGEVWVEQTAIGINFLDLQQRSGAVPISLPSGLGYEAAGRVAAIGSGVQGLKVGDRVAYAGGPIGAYAMARLFPAERLLRLPDDVADRDAVAILFKGITAQYLIKSTYAVKPGTTMLLYGPTGGVGQLMTRWAKHLGATVIGVVERGKEDVAKEVGCDEVISARGDIAGAVAEVTHGERVDVVYDPVGKDTFEGSLNSLKPRGMMVSFGNSSGSAPAITPDALNQKGSLYLTRPSVFTYTANAAEYRERGDDVLAMLAEGVIKPSIWKSFSFDDVTKAHEAIERRESTGAIVLEL
jgi:NADPH2:quinone reductase